MVVGCTGKAPAPQAACQPRGLLSVGEKIPDCSFPNFDGSTFELKSLEGTPSVLNFWASWCAPCLKEMPDFEVISKELAGRATIVGFNMLGVDGEAKEDARKFSTQRGVTYPLVFDADGIFYSHFAITPRLPTTIFLKADRTVAHRQFGPLTRAELRALIRKHLGV